MDDPHYYTYSYHSPDTGAATPGALGANYTAAGYGDLDCNGRVSTFEMYGVVNSNYADGPAGNAGLYRENELE